MHLFYVACLPRFFINETICPHAVVNHHDCFGDPYFKSSCGVAIQKSTGQVYKLYLYGFYQRTIVSTILWFLDDLGALLLQFPIFTELATRKTVILSPSYSFRLNRTAPTQKWSVLFRRPLQQN